MASITKEMWNDATCSICQQLMTEPTSVNCGHSFCKSCILGLLEPRICPLCQTPISRASCRPNKQLQSLIEILKKMDQKSLCKEHNEQLHLFCENDGQLICWCCERSPQHRGHVTVLVEDACQDYKEKLQKTLARLKNLEEKCQNQMTVTKQHIIECERVTENQKQNIESDFKSLQDFLREEEKSHLWRLENEKGKVLKRLQDNEANLQEQSQELKKHILQLEDKCRGPAQNLLQNVKEVLNRSSAVMLNLPETVSLDLDKKCNVSELYLDVKKILRSYQVNVTLDPETAHSDLILSEDHRRVTRGYEPRPHTSTRFTSLCCVLGCEGFASGRCYFEVDVRGITQCDLGVCLENVPRDVDITMEPASGFWGIRLFKEKNCAALTYPKLFLPQKNPGIIGVFLDYEAGFVSFYNMNTGSCIYTFPKAAFSRTLRPFFRVLPDSSLFLPPLSKA
ncbi:E3 ubiquitin-protein ligase TRIM38-like [Sorex araneus]|uniref:E3 ubiquitin-protein ligase TRIM38-like n=1 Tax=Sorex araneus TaxID=42254 RepID=UPI0024334F5D|nr:E3 ubiquitin-protein ligase TRIM38-like [Sorex araneus]